MPVTNSQKIPFAKYGVYVSDTLAGPYTLNKRLIVQNFRTQLRGLGSCGCIILPKDQINEQINQTVKEGMFVKILDCTTFFEDTYGSVGQELFVGVISSVTTDVYDGKDDDKGYAQIDEIGQYYAKLPIIWPSKPQVFNPIVEGTAYGNKKPDDLLFETKLADMATAKLDGTDSGKFPSNSQSATNKSNSRVWSLQDYLKYIAQMHNVEFKFPWDLDNAVLDKKKNKELEGLDANDPVDSVLINSINNEYNNKKEQNEKAYVYFKDTIDVKSYDPYDGKSIQELLDEYLDDPFNWYFTFESTGYVTIQIINVSPVLSSGFCPAAQLIQKVLDPDVTTNFNITKSDEVYDRVIYRGDNIMVAGTLSNWNNNSSASMDRDWTDTEEIKYVDANNETDASLAAAVRAKDKKVFQQFKYKHLEQSCPIQLAKHVNADTKIYDQAPMYPKDDGSEAYTMVAFFPRIDFVKYENNSTYVLPKPTVYADTTSHKTPPLLELKWADMLPWKVDNQTTWRKPFITTTSFQVDDGNIPRYFTYDLTKAGGGYDTISFKQNIKGYQVEIQYPETLSYIDEQKNIISCQTVAVDDLPNYWDESKISNRNPATTDYKFLTHWKMMAATVAGFSDQQLEWIVDNPNSNVRNKVKVIEDRSLQCWFVHAGTIKEVILGGFGVGTGTGRAYKTGYDRFQKDTFIRNDFQKVYDYARHAANWLFTPKASAKIEIALMKYTGGYALGEVIGEVVDKTIKRKINTAVASIEYDCVSNRVLISTNIPEMPILKKLQQSPSRSVVGPVSDSKSPTIESREKVIVKEEQPTHGYVSGGSGGGGTFEQKSHLYQVIGGNEISYLGENGIKKINSTFNQSISGSNGQPSTLPDGCGWLRRLDDNSYVVGLNDSSSLVEYDLVNQPVFAVVAPSISSSPTMTFYRIIGAL